MPINMPSTTRCTGCEHFRVTDEGSKRVIECNNYETECDSLNGNVETMKHNYSTDEWAYTFFAKKQGNPIKEGDVFVVDRIDKSVNEFMVTNIILKKVEG